MWAMGKDILNILHVNSSDLGGGAGRVAYRLACGQRQAGHNAQLLVGKKMSSEDWVQQITPSLRAFVVDKVVGKAVDALGIQYLFYPYTLRLIGHDWVQQAEVVNLHNLHSGNMGCLSWWILPRLARNATLVWTLHDMWTMTGHCAFPEMAECDRWKTGCGDCPDLKAVPPVTWDTTRLQWKMKRWLYQRIGTIAFVCPSRWLAEQARQSPLLQDFPVHHIPNGVDTSVFRAQEKGIARRILGITQNAPVLMVVSSADPRKGGSLLLDVMEHVSSKYAGDITLLWVGTGRTTPFSELSGVHLHAIGPVQSERMMALCYAAADLFLFPSIAENLPTVLLESLACGTPCVAFDTGGVKEIVRDQQTGYLVTRGDCADFAARTLELLGEPKRRYQMAESGLRLIKREYNLMDQARRYLELYQEVTGHKT